MKKRIVCILLCMVALLAVNLVARNTANDYIAEAEASSSAPPAPVISNPGGGRYHPVIISEEPENGTVFIDHRRATRSEQVQVTPSPDPGYAIESISVINGYNEAVSITDNEDGTFSFSMPSNAAYIHVTFKKTVPAAPLYGDVDESDPYFDAIEYVTKNGLMTGVNSGSFSPNELLTRAMFVTVLYRAEGEPEATGDYTFTDVAKGSVYEKPIIWAKANGLVNGYSETIFAPDELITRQQAATILHRYAIFKDYDVSVGEETNILSYEDASDVAEYAIAPFQYVLGAGIFSEKSAAVLKPNEYVSRAEFADILKRFIEANE